MYWVNDNISSRSTWSNRYMHSTALRWEVTTIVMKSWLFLYFGGDQLVLQTNISRLLQRSGKRPNKHYYCLKCIIGPVVSIGTPNHLRPEQIVNVRNAEPLASHPLVRNRQSNDQFKAGFVPVYNSSGFCYVVCLMRQWNTYRSLWRPSFVFTFNFKV